nr:hypothetical protein [Actinomadura physcomitrii]
MPVLDGMKVITRLRLQAHREAVEGKRPYPWPPPHPLTGEPLRNLADFDAAAFQDDAPVLAERAARGFDAAVAFARAWRPDLILHEGLLVIDAHARRHAAQHGRLHVQPVGGAPGQQLRAVVGGVCDQCHHVVASTGVHQRTDLRGVVGRRTDDELGGPIGQERAELVRHTALGDDALQISPWFMYAPKLAAAAARRISTIAAWVRGSARRT